jgi:hypothetical protein
MSDARKPPTPLSAAPDVRPRGRPVGSTRIAEPRAQAKVWLPISLFDKLDRLSVREGQSLSATIRQLLILKL